MAAKRSRRPRQPANITALLGSSGTGKTLRARALLRLEMLSPRERARALVWDFKHRDYQSEGCLVTDRLTDVYVSATAARFAVTYNPPHYPEFLRQRAFDAFCRISMDAGDCFVLVEELRYVTTPSRAPEAWSMLAMLGRDLGMRVVATSQRPASIDKDFLGNCTTIRCGRLMYPDDRTAVARVMGLRDPDELGRLDDLAYVERGPDGKITRGRIEL